MGTGLLAFCCHKCQCKLGKTCFLKKISTLIGKEMPQRFWKHIRCFWYGPQCVQRTQGIFCGEQIFSTITTCFVKKKKIIRSPK